MEEENEAEKNKGRAKKEEDDVRADGERRVDREKTTLRPRTSKRGGRRPLQAGQIRSGDVSDHCIAGMCYCSLYHQPNCSVLINVIIFSCSFNIYF